MCSTPWPPSPAFGAHPPQRSAPCLGTPRRRPGPTWYPLWFGDLDVSAPLVVGVSLLLHARLLPRLHLGDAVQRSRERATHLVMSVDDASPAPPADEAVQRRRRERRVRAVILCDGLAHPLLPRTVLRSAWSLQSHLHTASGMAVGTPKRRRRIWRNRRSCTCAPFVGTERMTRPEFAHEDERTWAAS